MKLKWFNGLMVLVSLLVTFFISTLSVNASSLSLNEMTSYSYTGHSPNVGYVMTHQIYVLKMDGKKVFCIQSGLPTNSGQGYIPETYISSKKEKLSQIAYYGYTDTKQTHLDYATTQVMIWEELGDKYQSSTIPNYKERKANIMEKVNRHDVLPSFNNQSVSIKIGESLILTDTNNVLKDMTLDSNSTKATIIKNGNKLTISPNKNSNNGSIIFRKVPQNAVGNSIVYKKPNEQSMVEFHLSSSKQAIVKVKVMKVGNIQAKKIDKETGKALPNAKLKFEYNETSKEITTNQSGLAIINDIPEGTTVTVTEVTAPNGYINKGDIKKIVIKPNETVFVTLNNKEQLGQVLLNKTGKEFGTTMLNDYYSLKGAIYDIYQEDGTKISSMTTDNHGKAISPFLKLGKYYALESKAPNGYLLNTTKVPFELKYAGQTVEITSTTIVQEEQEQKGNAMLIKEDTKTGSTPQGAATLEGATYELHRKSTDELVEKVTIKDGQAIVKDLYLDDYYWIETKAPTGYLLDKAKYPFTLKYNGQTTKTAVHSMTVKETVITGGFDLIKIGNYDWKGKLGNLLNKEEIKPLEQVEFSVFSDTTRKLVRKGVTDKEGYLKFSNLPFDTYTIKETKTPEGYEAIKDFKVTIHEQDEIHHYTIENKVIEEKLKVVKVDSESGKAIPRTDAGFQIRNLQTGQLVSMPKTNEEGQVDTFFTNEEGYLITATTLAHGEYELIEVQAPHGYVLAKEPVKFKIDGSHKGILEIKFEDNSQKGIATLTKTGQKPIDVKTKESHYGTVHEFIFDYTPVEKVSFRIEATDDIKTNDGTTHVKKGEVIGTYTTNELGILNSPELYLGKYQLIETAAPKGLVLNPTPIPFELKYAGQQIELTSTSLIVTNEFQSLAIGLFKEQESIASWKDNHPKIESVKGNQQVFGLFTRGAQQVSENIQVPENTLVAYKKVKEGIAHFDVQLPQGTYFLKELDAGSNHVIRDEEYDIEFTAENNHAIFPIHVYNNTVIYGKEIDQANPHESIVNQLYFNQFTIKKVNEKATFEKNKGINFDFDTLGIGAVFSLKDDKEKMIQEITIDKDGVGVFTHIPVGTFYLQEKTPSSDNHLLSSEIIRIESTKNGIKAFNGKKKLIGEGDFSKEKKNLKNQLFYSH